MQEITKIKPHSRWLDLNLKEIWAHRELLYFLTWRDIKVRYKQTAIGVLWAILQPVLTTAIFTVIFSQFARFESLRVAYPPFALSGLLLWLFVNNSITQSSNSLTSNTNLVTKIYFPRLIMPAAAAFANLPDLLLGLLILAGLMIYYGTAFAWQIVFAPLFVALAVLLALSGGVLFAALNVRFRDVKFALPFLLQIWMFLSPIFYPSESLPERWRMFFLLNPLTGILQGFRTSLFGGDFDRLAIGVAVILTAGLAILSFFVFKWMEDDFADLV